MKIQCAGGSRSFAKYTSVLKMSLEEWWLAIRSWQQPIESHHWSWSSYVLRSCWRTQKLTILWSFGIWSKLESWKSSISGHLMNLWKKKSLFWSVIFSYSTQQWTISWLDCDVWQKVNFIWWPVMTSSVAGLRRSSKAVPKAKLVPKKIIAPVWLSVAHLIHYTLWIPVKPLHLRSMLSKSMRCTENCNACIWYW